ncbi:MAG TPA: efflux RND transporter periplasmic adaptor subunit [Thermoanaerobaculia bacterium]|jgi:cobalt-zinc-cadmium efflux system membrane fusion protein|nr:efflux RND transporter periplasmic adaptor subunit [Thermoanaerobaculia bacterium]
MTCRITLFLALALLFSVGCKKSDETSHESREHAHSAGEAAAGDHEEQGRDEGTPRSIDLAGVRGVSFAVVGPPREEGAWFAAEAISETGSAATFSAPVGGIVTALLVEPGRAVSRGAALVEIRSPELAEKKAAWLAARSRRAQADREVARERRLLEGGATSQRDLEAAEAAAAVAEVEEASARLALEARGVDPASAGTTYRVRAARAGVVESFAVAVGQGVEAGGDLGRLIAPGASRVLVEIPLPGPESWEEGATTEVRRASGQRWQATVEGVPASLSDATRRLTYRLRLSGEAGTLPLAGTPLEVRVPLAQAVVLPQVALQQIEGTWGVFVKTAGRAELRPVRKGAELGAEVLVLEGISPGETIATDGAYLLKSLYLKLAGGGSDEHGH